MWLKEVNVEKITGGQAFGSAVALSTTFDSNYWHNNNKYIVDTFSRTLPKINPAMHNPLYAIKDDYLVNILPSELVKKYSNPNFLRVVAKTNPNISSSLEQVRIPVKVYSANVSSEIHPHFMPTLKTAYAIMKNSGINFTKDDYATMGKAALLHDIGKAYIPEEILNKQGKLNIYEKSIVDKHAQLGYEILRTADVDTLVLTLVKNHHLYSKNNPALVQILQISDIWSALKEKRPYKEAFSDTQAIKILYERVNNGDFDKKYIDALVKSLNSTK